MLAQHFPDGKDVLRYVVVSEYRPGDGLYVVTPEQAARFTYKEIVVERKLDGLGQHVSPWALGITKGATSWLRSYCIVEGMIPEHRMTPRNPFEPIALPAEINPEGLERLLEALGERCGVRKLIDVNNPRPGLVQVMSELDDRQITAIILRYGLIDGRVMSYEAVGKHLGLKRPRTREIVIGAEGMIRFGTRGSN